MIHTRLLKQHTLAFSALVLISAALFGSVVRASSQTGANDGHVLVVTSDSTAYCHSLSGMIEAHGALPREVKELKTQGDGMCGEGHVRGGIARLRRALLVLHRATADTEQP